MSVEHALDVAIRWLDRVLLCLAVVDIPIEILNGHAGHAVCFYLLAIWLLRWRIR